jgi:ribosomal-protein-alanine N-acetyltransferase
MKLEISEMTFADLDCLKDILITDFDDFWNYDILKTELESKNSRYIVAKNNTEIVGFAGIKIVMEQADIMNIVTKKSFRNYGVASSLLKKLIDICKTLNVSSIMLEVNEENLPAICLYKKFGFETLSIRKNYYGTNSAIIMKKELLLN